MQESQSSTSTGQSSHLFSSALRTSHSLFTPFITKRRVGFTLASAFLVTGAALALNGGAAGNTANGTKHFEVQASSDSTAPSADDTSSTPTANDSSSSSTNVSASVNSNGSPQVQLQVNGQDVAVPDNGSTQHTVTSQDGSTTTTVDVSSSNQSSATNSNNSSFNLNIQSNSSSSGGTTSQ